MKGICECDNPLHYFDGTKCIECFHPKYFDYTDHACKGCPKNQIYSIKYKKCIECPQKYPHFDGKRCNLCPQNTIWDPKAKECKACEGGKILVGNIC